MIGNVLHAEFLKVKRKWIWFLVFLGPFGIVALQAVNYGVRYDYLVQPDSDVWNELMLNLGGFIPLTLMLGISILASMTASIEHQQNSWKQLLALPVSRVTVLMVKVLIHILLLFVSCLLLPLGIIGLGLILKFGVDFPLLSIAKNSIYPLFAAIPFLVFQVWLSIRMSNQAIPLTIGIFSAIISIMSTRMSDWVIFKWVSLSSDSHDPEWFVVAGILTGAVVFIVSMIDFVKRDVK